MGILQATKKTRPTTKKPSPGPPTHLWIYPLYSFAVILVVAFTKTVIVGDALTTMMPNTLLYTPFRETTKSLWSELVSFEGRATYDHSHIPILEASDYTMESLRAATDNFRNPAMVRGLFKGCTALQKWTDPDYLADKIGSFAVPVVQNAVGGDHQQEARDIVTFSSAIKEILSTPISKKYLFIPVLSRLHTEGSSLGANNELKRQVNALVRQDVELDRIWPGFGSSSHLTFFGSQLIVGQGRNDTDATTGTNWHCAAGNNWFVQVTGKKRWYFMSPAHSKLMKPVRSGQASFQTSDAAQGDYHAKMPLAYADLQEGDLLYNPDWQWHTIKNYNGLSIGVPVREFNIIYSLRNNLHYTTVTAVNTFWKLLGIDVGGY